MASILVVIPNSQSGDSSVCGRVERYLSSRFPEHDFVLIEDEDLGEEDAFVVMPLNDTQIRENGVEVPAEPLTFDTMKLVAEVLDGFDRPKLEMRRPTLH